jgi:hypothetical protein
MQGPTRTRKTDILVSSSSLRSDASLPSRSAPPGWSWGWSCSSSDLASSQSLVAPPLPRPVIVAVPVRPLVRCRGKSDRAGWRRRTWVGAVGGHQDGGGEHAWTAPWDLGAPTWARRAWREGSWWASVRPEMPASAAKNSCSLRRPGPQPMGTRARPGSLEAAQDLSRCGREHDLEVWNRSWAHDLHGAMALPRTHRCGPEHDLEP